MTRTKKTLVAAAFAVALGLGAATPALADQHATCGDTTTQDQHATSGDATADDQHAT
ncbi:MULTISPECIES: hypothetical protein [unclassified Streptomyces]|uniref:hypothetical protein n=1 Tax=unclassified Streptomyces TaxID=2593676 RepID=UPI0022582E8B|nr:MULTISPECIES: hypothetical protein [unclassified Streptomyces]WSP56779.1 hypothetical protein OG306_22205 [Streptomyces sp. NBC_01241]WSU22503.1 hypothetical protein OG508_17025 [Streptomyces sp. NBC_01108]MCX4788538.1 hypothetical protein [Streptomyces sp. NBC_01221]MCX4795702.1 hypothetical protein [Streptomyces sp. NBC_01242]WSJ36994.1 hypothetical protein OG772_13725 [Streptomyces sp. NBC_01321]